MSRSLRSRRGKTAETGILTSNVELSQSQISPPATEAEHGKRKRDSPRRRVRRDKLRQEQILHYLRGQGTILAILGAAQHALKLYLIRRPNYSDVTGTRFLDIAKLRTTISCYRCFHNINEWLTVYEMQKAHRHDKRHGDKPRDKFNDAMSTCWNAAYLGYLIPEAIAFLGYFGILRLSRDPGKHASRCASLDRNSCRSWAGTMVIKLVRDAREYVHDRRKIKQHRKQVAAGLIAHEVDVEFRKTMAARSSMRKKKNLINLAWTPGAFHWCAKKSPFGAMGPTIASCSAIAAQLTKSYYYIADARKFSPS